VKQTNSSETVPDYRARLAAVRGAMVEGGIDCLLVCSRENIRYLFGFTGSSGWALITESSAVLMTDSRYDEQARTETTGCEVCISTKGLTETAAQQLHKCHVKRVGYESDSMTVATLHTLESTLRENGLDLVLTPTQQIVERVRSIKDRYEIAAISAASRLVDGAIDHARSIIRADMTEQTLAWEIERWLREHGSGPVPFPVIVAAGPHCAHPHAVSGDNRLACGEPILIDIGAVIDGYCSDLSRTLFIGQPNDTIRRVYETVLEAQETALCRVRAGMSAPEADRLARNVIAQAGYADSFGHGLGHGVGLAIHERPTVSSLSTDILRKGMVFTIEPGIYLRGLGGVRIEDTVVLRESGVQLLTHTDKRNPVLCATC